MSIEEPLPPNYEKLDVALRSIGYSFHVAVADVIDNSIDAHIRHGDGEATTIFDPPLHLSSEGQNHLGANVECVADLRLP